MRGLRFGLGFNGGSGGLSTTPTTVTLTPQQAGASRFWDARDADSVGISSGTTVTDWTDQIASDAVPVVGTGVDFDEANGFITGDGNGYFSRDTDGGANPLPVNDTPFTIMIIGETRSGDTGGGNSNTVSITDTTNNNNNFFTELVELTTLGQFSTRTIARVGAYDQVDSSNSVGSSDETFIAVGVQGGTTNRTSYLNHRGKVTENANINPNSANLNRFNIGALVRTTVSIRRFKIKAIVIWDRVATEHEQYAVSNNILGITPALTYTTNHFMRGGKTNPWYPITWPSTIETDDWLIASYEGWTTKRNQIVSLYDKSNNRWYPSDIVHATIGDLTDDDHGNAAIAEMSSGHMFTFSHAHSTNPIQVYSTLEAGDPRGWSYKGALTVTSPTYPNPVVTSATNIDLFHRDNNYDLAIVPLTISGNSYTEGSATTLISWSGFRVYFSITTTVGDETYILATRSPNVDTYREDVYLFIYDHVAETIRDIDSTVSYGTADFPIDLTESNSDFRIQSTTSEGGGSYVSGIFDDSSNFHVCYTDGASAAATTFDVMHMYHNGSTWSTPAQVLSAEGGSRFDKISLYRNDAGNPVVVWNAKEAGDTFGRGGDIRQAVWNGSWGSETLIAEPTDLYPLGEPKSVEKTSTLAKFQFTETEDLGALGGNGADDDQGGNLRGYLHTGSSFLSRQWSTLPFTNEWVNRLSGTPSDDVIEAVDEFMDALVNQNLIWLLDAAYLLTDVTGTDADRHLNLIDDIWNLTANGSLTYGDNGIAGDGSTGYLATGFNASEDTALYSVDGNGQSVGIWCLDSEGSNGTSLFGIIDDGDFTNELVKFQPRNASDTMFAYIEQTDSFTATVTDASGFWTVNRASNNDREVWRNGVSIATDTGDAYAQSEGELVFFRDRTFYDDRECAFAFFGRDLSDNDYGLLYKAVQRLLTRLGAI